VNAVIKAYRDAGARNVIIVQAINADFRGFPGGVVDPLNQIAYSAHPFFGPRPTDEDDWNARFGDFAGSHPFVITAWGELPRGAWCGPNDINTPVRFMQYLHDRHISWVGFAFDSPSSMVSDMAGTPSTWPDRCGVRGGLGELFKKYR
jgi:endoglucanase